ncbi:MAG TPA: lysozyme [Longimicrobiaceae bacterium]|jgi:lysozyme|nr:lysozyme [Longimicrobiaceae bacterium]
MKTSGSGIALLRGFEGVRHTAYKDQAGRWTTGAGHLIKLPAEQNLLAATLTDAEIDALLARDAGVAEASVSQQVKVPLTQNRFDALVSLVYNIGDGAFASSTVLQKINGGAPEAEVRAAWAMWDKVTDPATKQHKVSDDLVKRRKAEADLYFGG